MSSPQLPPFQLRSGSLGLLWAACSWTIVQIFWVDLGPNSWPCLCLMMGLTVGSIAVELPHLGCVHPQLLASIIPENSPYFSCLLPWSCMDPQPLPMFRSPLSDCWTVDETCCLQNCEGTAMPVLWSSSAHLPWRWSSLQIAHVWQSIGIGIVGEREVCKGWLGKKGRWENSEEGSISPAATTSSHISDSWPQLCQRRSQWMCCFSSTSGEAAIVPTLWS